MTLFPAHRAAEEFDDVLAGRATTAVAERHASLLHTVQVLRSAPEVKPRSEFSADLRERLMAAAVTELRPLAPAARRLPASPTRRRHRRAGTIAATLVVVGGSAGMAAAASGALPGEPLYPIKRGIEETTTALRTGDAAEGTALLGQAETRMDELAALMQDGDASQALLTSTVDGFRSSADQGAVKLFEAYQSDGEAAHIDTVRAFTTSQMAVVDDLSSSSDKDSVALLVDVADTLADLDQQARVLCDTCGPQAAAAPPASLTDASAALALQNLVVRPVEQAETDVALADRLQQLQQAAQGAADQTPTETSAGSGTSTEAGTGSDGPLTSTITRSGDLLPTITAKEPVTGLVEGVTGTLKERDGAGELTDKLGDTVDGVTDTVDDATGGLLP